MPHVCDIRLGAACRVAEDRGVSTDEAEERAARTVNKERTEAGETKAQKKDRSR